MSRISADVRERAALICSIAASSGCRSYYNLVLDDLGEPYDEACSLAIKAWRQCRDVDIGAVLDRNRGWSRERDAEAEALLRTGWSPKGRR